MIILTQHRSKDTFFSVFTKIVFRTYSIFSLPHYLAGKKSIEGRKHAHSFSQIFKVITPLNKSCQSKAKQMHVLPYRDGLLGISHLAVSMFRLTFVEHMTIAHVALSKRLTVAAKKLLTKILKTTLLFDFCDELMGCCCCYY